MHLRSMRKDTVGLRDISSVKRDNDGLRMIHHQLRTQSESQGDSLAALKEAPFPAHNEWTE